MTIQQLRSARVPFTVRSVHDRRRRATITAFSDNDPLGVGAGLGLTLTTAYFSGGGWCLVSDLLKHWDIFDEAERAAARLFPRNPNFKLRTP